MGNNQQVPGAFALPPKKRVTNAGEVIRAHATERDLPVLLDALNVLSAWRGSFDHPLQTVYMRLRKRAARIDPQTVVSRRLKRTPSIITKLLRQPEMQLARMQDIGGCRAVVRSMDDLRMLMATFPKLAHDYLSHPKPDGYRSVHVVEEYKAKSPQFQHLDRHRIEVQLRTELQHAWATTVETVDMLLNQKLKVGGGDAMWRRFFQLTASAIAIEEGCPCVPDTPTDRDALMGELRALSEQLRVVDVLTGLRTSAKRIIGVSGGPSIRAYILVLDLKARSIRPYGFAKADIARSLERYLELEKQHFNDQTKEVVHVYVNSVKQLKKAYPNYYLDSKRFLDWLSAVLVL